MRGLDVLVATPGRLLDHLSSGAVRLDGTTTIVLDEADHMLDLGFLPPIRKIFAKLPKTRQTLFFSATMPTEIGSLAGEMLHEPVKVSVAPIAKTADRVEQRVILVEGSGKRQALINLMKDPRFFALHRLHPHQARRGSRRWLSQRRRFHGRRHSRQQEPESAPARAGRF